MTETEYVSQMLTKIKRFAQHYDVHVWFVAHPRQLRDWKGEPPNLYDISGSAHFINKADNGIVIHRNRDPTRGSLNQVAPGGLWPQECPYRKILFKIVLHISRVSDRRNRQCGFAPVELATQVVCARNQKRSWTWTRVATVLFCAAGAGAGA